MAFPKGEDSGAEEKPNERRRRFDTKSYGQTDHPRRVTLEELCDYIGGLDYLNGRILTKSGIELLVGVKEFAESITALKEGGE